MSLIIYQRDPSQKHQCDSNCTKFVSLIKVLLESQYTISGFIKGSTEKVKVLVFWG